MQTPSEASRPPRVLVFSTEAEAAAAAGAAVFRLLAERRAAGRPAALGLAAGRSPQGLYSDLARRVVGRATVVGFALDEYYPMDPRSPRSFRRWLEERFLRPLGLPDAALRTPDGSVPRDGVAAVCARYEAEIARAGGIDLQVLGLGRNGHVGFNEPGSPFDSRTRLVRLAPETRADAAADFERPEEVPREAITMGLGTIREARRILLLAFGKKKAGIVRRFLRDPVGENVPATCLRGHPAVEVYLDREAGGELCERG